MYILLLLLIPVVWPIAARHIWHQEITWFETVINIMVTSMLTLAVYFGSIYVSIQDTATINGEVISKSRDNVSCKHSYQCRCRSVGSGKSRHTTCDTCYEHGYDVEWNVRASVGSVQINTMDRQGLREPPRWTQVAIHDPFTTTQTYINYIKAAPDSLFNRVVANQYLKQVPEYPQSLYDYYKMSRVVVDGAPGVDSGQWNTELANQLKEIGAKKQANVVLLFTKNKDPHFAEAVAYKWLGGKKNDIVVVMGTPEYPKLKWVKIYTWSKHSIFEIKLRDALSMDEGLNPEKTITQIRNLVVQYYDQKPIEDFKYLENELDPPWWVLVAALVGSLIFTGILTKVFHSNNWKN